MSKPINVPDSTESTTETTAAPAARKKPMARKKAPVYVPEVFNVGELKQEVQQVRVGRKGTEYEGGLSWYDVTSRMVKLTFVLYKKEAPGIAEITVMMAMIGMSRGKTPLDIRRERASFEDADREQIVRTIYAGITGVPQQGMDEGVAKHLSELHADYKATWAAYIRTPEGMELMAGRRAKAGKAGATVPDPVQSKYGFSGASGKSKATGGQQALTTRERQEALIEATARKKGGLLERAMGK